MSSALGSWPLRENGAEGRPSAVSFDEIGSDAIVPSQYYDARHPSVCSDGEHRLMFAVLKTAISDYLRASEPQTRQGRTRSEAGAWIMNKCPASGVLAYEMVCETLGIEPDCLRKELLSLARRSVVPRLRSQPVLPASRQVIAAR